MIYLLYSLVSYLMFLASFGYLALFAEGFWVPKAVDSGPSGSPALAIALDLCLIALFGIQHSVMARDWFKRRWTRIVPAAAERSTFVLATSAAFGLLFWKWRALPEAVWSVTNPTARGALFGASIGGWALVVVSSYLIDHFELFGLRQGWNAFRGNEATPGPFRTPALYRWVRHPMYTGLVVGFWAAPTMTEGHLLLAAGFTAYILLGIFFEEKDLVRDFGDQYVAYRARVGMLLPRFRGRGD